MFESYNRIEESTSNWIVNSKLFNKCKWCVTEKIHGANFCIIFDGQNFKYAKRKEILEQNDEFFNYKTILPEVEPKIKKLFEEIKENKISIMIFGELFGGEYPHKDVKKISNFQAIQTGVYYSPKIEFCAFDIQIVNENELKYLDFENSLKLFKSVDLFHAEPLFIGKYEDAISYNVTFESTIPVKLNLPKLKANQAEGIVVKPMKTLYGKSLKGEKKRIILKYKPKEFKEDLKYLKAEKWVQNDSNQFNENISNYDMMFFEIQSLITVQRLENGISKIGFIDSNKKAENLMNLFIEDVFQSAEENKQKN
eukprot:gene6809-10974_t